ncbi:hypothetical protein [Paenibacillus sp. sgz5001063]|uniref:hypothetical protein n=1 Tax=Paenibacillus sp. sgz5001063 TaxID=3242474 RepID=UPI0036D3C069
MKKQNLIKWLIGVTGAVLFTGFIGYINHSEAAQSDSSLAISSGYEQAQEPNRDSTADGPRQRRGDFGSGFSGSTGSEDSRGEGRIRTQAS